MSVEGSGIVTPKVIDEAETFVDRVNDLNDLERRALVERLELECLRPIMPYHWESR